MKIIRAKAVRKCLRFFKIVYDIKGPYEIILDGNFMFTAIKLKVDIKDRLQKLLQGEEVRLYVLRSVLVELQQVGAKALSTLEYAKSFCEVIEDSRFQGETPKDRAICMMRQQHRDWIAASSSTPSSSSSSSSARIKRYFIASQDRELRSALGSTPGVPLIYLNKVTLVLEPPSSASLEFNKEVCNACV